MHKCYLTPQKHILYKRAGKQRGEDIKGCGVFTHSRHGNGNTLEQQVICLQCTVLDNNRVMKAPPVSLKAVMKPDVLYSKLSLAP